MRIYLAGTPGMLSREQAWQKVLKRRLLSFWELIDPNSKHHAVVESFKLFKK